MINEDSLSAQQKRVVNQDGIFVVKACPGSGKTYSVAARIARLLHDPQFDFSRKGIAALSFTNVAWQEIEKKLKEAFNVKTPVGYPHFIGTIDSFINQYIFLPFGHLIMSCGKRPELVGEPYNRWYYPNLGNGEKAFYQYFDLFSFDIAGEVIPIGNILNTFFGGKYLHLRNHIRSSKETLFKDGKANQSDAIYIAHRILKDYSLIGKGILNRFSHFIIDEGQDTNDLQIAIIDILKDKGLNQIALIGDPDQAIFEWNNARPELFTKKYELEKWCRIDLNENRRSSRSICDCSRHLLGIPNYEVIGADKDYNYKPRVVMHKEDEKSVNQIVQEYLQCCKDRQITINSEDVAVLFRSRRVVGKWCGVSTIEETEEPWLTNHGYVREIVFGKFLLESGDFRRGFRSIERGYHKAVEPGLKFCSEEFINNKIEELGFKSYRNKIFQFANLLPPTREAVLKQWIAEANQLLLSDKINIKLSTHAKKSDVAIKNLFKMDAQPSNAECFLGTIHSAKGKTFEAVMLVLAHKAGNSNYETLLFPKKTLSSKQKEELRTVYVAMTRPRKILWIAVPESDCEVWRKKLDIT